MSFNWGIGVCMFAIFPLEVLIARGRSEYGVGKTNGLVRGLKLVDKCDRCLDTFCIYEYTNAGGFVIIGILFVYDVLGRHFN